jgi:hypothetical protein
VTERGGKDEVRDSQDGAGEGSWPEAGDVKSDMADVVPDGAG